MWNSNVPELCYLKQREHTNANLFPALFKLSDQFKNQSLSVNMPGFLFVSVHPIFLLVLYVT